jgi:hypothetical protein
MTRKHHLLVMVCLVAGLTCFAFAADKAKAPAKPVEQLIKAGFAERDITPQIGMEQPGGYGKVQHRTFHDPCLVRAAVFDDGKKRVAIVGLDALIIRDENVASIRKKIQAACGIAPEAVLLAASHSHSSGPTGMVYPGEYDSAPELIKDLAYNKSSCADLKYLEMMEQQTVDAVVAADKAKVDARCAVGKGLEPTVAFNRRFRMKNGMSYTHPGVGNPDIVEPAGPIDPEVGVIGAWDTSGKLLGVVVNFSCHATTSPGGISSNFPGYLENVVQGVFGKDVPVVFTNGACGDVTQVDNLAKRQQLTGERMRQLVGGRVGAEVIKVLLGLTPGSMGPVDFKTTNLKIARRMPSQETLARAHELIKEKPSGAMITDWTFAKESIMAAYLIEKEPIKNVEVQVIQVGPAVFVSNPAEYFVQYGLDIKKGSKFPFTFPTELSNGIVGYVPTEEAFSEHGGGYETRLTAYSNLEVTAGTKIAKAGIELANSLTPGEAPQAPPITPRPSAWLYGNVPPGLK